MKKIEILVFGKHLDILNTVIRLINANHHWQAEGTMVVEEVFEKCQLKAYDLVLLGSGIAQEEENKVKRVLSKLRPELKIIQHYGGGSGLLSNEIRAAIESNISKGFQIIDNVLN